MTGVSRKINFAGVGNGISATLYYIRLRFEHHKFEDNPFQAMKCYCCARKLLNQDIILGMDFLSKFEITFSGKHKKVIIVESPED